MKFSSRKALAVSIVVIPLLLIHFVTPPPGGLWMRVFYDSLHVPMFGVIAVGAFWATPAHWHIQTRLVATISVVIGLAVLSEAAQIATERDASVRDLLSDFLGGAGFLCLAIASSSSFSFSKSRRLQTVLLGAFLLALPLIPLAKVSAAYVQRYQFLPSLVAFDAPFGTALVSLQDAKLGTRQNTDGDGLSAIILLRDGPWPGIALPDVWPNWEPYSQLTIEIENPGADVLPINVRVDDRDHRSSQQHDDRFSRGFELPPGRHSLHIELGEIQDAPISRQMNLREIDNLFIFATRKEAGRRFVLHDIRLE